MKIIIFKIILGGVIAGFILATIAFVLFTVNVRRVEIPVSPTPHQQATGPKNPTVQNPQNDLTVSNDLEAISLIWDRDDRTVNYVLFRSDSVDGPFTEFDQVRTGLEIRTNYSDFTPYALTKKLCYKIEARDAQDNTFRVYEPVCIPPYKSEVKNPTFANPKNDLVGNNNLEANGLVWGRDDRAKKYILFRSESINGPFTEIGSIPAGGEFRTNAEDITTDAQIKTLCYKVEARDEQNIPFRVYEPVCILPWKN